MSKKFFAEKFGLSSPKVKCIHKVPIRCLDSAIIMSKILLYFVFQGENGSIYNESNSFECLPCAEGCETCVNSSPCILTLNWMLRSVILGLSCLIIFILFIVEFFTWKYRNVQVSIASKCSKFLPYLSRLFASQSVMMSEHIGM